MHTTRGLSRPFNAWEILCHVVLYGAVYGRGIVSRWDDHWGLGIRKGGNATKNLGIELRQKDEVTVVDFDFGGPRCKRPSCMFCQFELAF
jgi:hypothetical protein